MVPLSLPGNGKCKLYGVVKGRSNGTGKCLKGSKANVCADALPLWEARSRFICAYALL